MKKKIILLCLFFAIVLVGCQNENVMDNILSQDSTSLDDDKAIIQQLGLDANTLVDKGSYYLVEGDIVLMKKDLKQYLKESRNSSDNGSTLKQGIQGNNQLVSLAKVKNMTIRIDNTTVPESGTGSAWRAAVQTAVNAWNNIPGSCIRFTYTTATAADITVERTYENSSNIAWTGLPTNGVPSNKIYVNSEYDNYTNMANTIIHEMGHSIGLLHSHETPASQGGVLVPGTPQIDDLSIMSYTRDRTLLPGFSANDIIAIQYLYPDPNNPITVSSQSTCADCILTYSFTGLELTPSISLTWQAISNSILVSEQGTSATFRTTGNGSVKVRANVNYNYITPGYSFSIPIEHSNTWAGTPAGNSSVTTIVIGPKELVGSVTLGEDIKGATTYQWGGMFPPQYKGGKTSSIVSVEKKYILAQDGMIVWVDASNAYGTTRITYRVVVMGLE